MALPGETLASRGGTEFHKCEDCGFVLVPRVLQSGAGYYIGTFCANCGPYSRESGYYKTWGEAQRDLNSGNFSR